VTAGALLLALPWCMHFMQLQAALCRAQIMDCFSPIHTAIGNTCGVQDLQCHQNAILLF
jgi:hypothetical protein